MPEIPVNADSKPLDSSAGTLEIVSRAARDGAADARAAAVRVCNATSLFLSRFVYTTCYTVSYGVVFPTMLLVHAIPKNNAAVQGLVDGAHAAILKVDQVRTASTGLEARTGAPSLAPA
jgi:hypothetical protein